MDSFGAFIKMRRLMLELTQSDVAKRAMCSKSMISMLESGAVKPPLAPGVRRLAKALKLKVAPLLLRAHIERAPEEIKGLLELKLL